MIGYAFILNGKVVINPEKKPRKMFFSRKGHKFLRPSYIFKSKEWESNCIEAENVTMRDGYWQFIYDDGDTSNCSGLILFVSGSQVEHDGPVITKIY